MPAIRWSEAPLKAKSFKRSLIKNNSISNSKSQPTKDADKRLTSIQEPIHNNNNIQTRTDRTSYSDKVYSKTSACFESNWGSESKQDNPGKLEENYTKGFDLSTWRCAKRLQDETHFKISRFCLRFEKGILRFAFIHFWTLSRDEVF